MDYTLALELKEKGFPNMVFEGLFKGEEIWRKPSLEELIEACGSGVTLAVGGDIEINQPDGTQIRSNGSIASKSPFMGEGKTPTEAVARLWLALNKK